MRTISITNLFLTLFFVLMYTPTFSQKKVLIVFAEESQFKIPFRFIKSKEKNTYDSVQLKQLTLRYQFYNVFTQRLVENSFMPIGGLNETINASRKYAKRKWFFNDSLLQKKNKGKYTAAVIDATNNSFYNMYLTADAIDYIIFINKISVETNFFKKLFATKNYSMNVDFDVYDNKMKHIAGRSLQQNVRLTKGMYWSAFEKHFSALPEELALYFINLKK